jgi:hypothetical protein
MTHSGIFNEYDDSIELKRLKKELKKIKDDKERGDNDLEKTIDILETDLGIKDWHIKRLQDEIIELKDALEKTE